MSGRTADEIFAKAQELIWYIGSHIEDNLALSLLVEGAANELAEFVYSVPEPTPADLAACQPSEALTARARVAVLGQTGVYQ